jgi:hypothetical protein
MRNAILKHVPEMTKHFGKDLAFLTIICFATIAALAFTQNGIWLTLVFLIAVCAWGLKKCFGWQD